MSTDHDAKRQRSEAARVTAAVLQSLDDVGTPLRHKLTQPMTLPEGAIVLDLASRKGDRTRMVKHVHQMCVLHTMQYRTATEMKVAHLIDAFETLARAGNGLALYPIARSALELLAQVFDVSRRLTSAQQSVASRSWLPGGEEFFKVIVRARFATSNADHRRMLLEDGASKKSLEPMSSGKAIGLLAELPNARHAQARYDDLCDAVHHNLGASTAITAGSGVDTAARNSRGGMILSSTPNMTVIAYEYPVVWKADIAVARIGHDFVDDVRTTLDLLDCFPESPFSQRLLEEFTGHPLGVVPIARRPDGRPILPPARSEKQPRNDACSCGSGRKYKLCCGA